MRRAILILPVFICSGALWADEMYQGVDIGPMVRLFQSQVVTLNRSVTTYNWADQRSDAPGWSATIWGKESDQDDPTLLAAVRDLAGSFWREFRMANDSTSQFGYGLYLASDPEVSRGWGGRDWRLIQVEFPAGTRMLDFADFAAGQAQDPALANATMDIEGRFDCHPQTVAALLLSTDGFRVGPKCRELIHHVFNDVLKVDALAYKYTGMNFRECESSQLAFRAFVVMRPDSLLPGNVHVYNARSRLNESERIRIQTLTLKAGGEEQSDAPMAHKIREKAHAFFAQFFNSSITAEEARNSGLLWSDLLGKPKPRSISAWLKRNEFGCDGTLPYSQN